MECLGALKFGQPEIRAEITEPIGIVGRVVSDGGGSVAVRSGACNAGERRILAGESEGESAGVRDRWSMGAEPHVNVTESCIGICVVPEALCSRLIFLRDSTSPYGTPDRSGFRCK